MTFEPFRSIVLPKGEHARPEDDLPTAPSPPRPKSLHDVERGDHVEEVVRPPSTVVSKEWVYANTQSEVESALGQNSPREATISGPTAPTQGSAPTAPATSELPPAPEPRPIPAPSPSGAIQAREVTLGGVPDLHMDPLPARETREGRSEAVPRLRPTGESEGETISIALPRESTVAPAPSLPARAPEPSPAEPPARPSPKVPKKAHASDGSTRSEPRVFVVAYDGSLIGTYKSLKRIQNKTAYQKVAEQLVGQFDDFDPRKIQLFKLTEIPNKGAFEAIEAEFESFPREVPSPSSTLP